MNPEDLDDLRERDKLKKTYRQMGVPVGFGAAPPQTPTLSEAVRRERDRMESEAQEDAIIDQMPYAEMGSDYQSKMLPGDKAQIVKFIHEVTPFKIREEIDEHGNKKRIIEEGAAPLDSFMLYAPWLMPVDGLSFLDEREICVREVDLELYDLEVMFTLDRADYTPEKNMYCTGLKALANLKIRTNRDALGMYLAAAEVSDETKNIGVKKQRRARLENLANAIRGE